MAKNPIKLEGNVFFNGVECDVYETEYAHSETLALFLVERATGEQYATATVYVEGATEALPPGHVLVKNYAENAGMMGALQYAGIALDTGRSVRTGYVEVPVARLLYEREGSSRSALRAS